jgi:histidine triad (HIT) family protein
VTDGCIFCTLVKQGAALPHRVAETDRAFAFLDIRPIRIGHTLVIPKAHASDLHDVRPDDWRATSELVTAVARRLRERLGTSGENLLVASGPGSEQSVFHLHVHVIPRRPNDDLRWTDWWETKVKRVSEDELAELARTIR